MGRGTCRPAPRAPPSLPASSRFPGPIPPPPGPESGFSLISPEPSGSPRGSGRRQPKKGPLRILEAPAAVSLTPAKVVQSSRWGRLLAGRSSGSWARGFQGRHLLRRPQPGSGFGAVELRLAERAHSFLELQRALGVCGEWVASPLCSLGRQPHGEAGRSQGRGCVCVCGVCAMCICEVCAHGVCVCVYAWERVTASRKCRLSSWPGSCHRGQHALPARERVLGVEPSAVRAGVPTRVLLRSTGLPPLWLRGLVPCSCFTVDGPGIQHPRNF